MGLRVGEAGEGLAPGSGGARAGAEMRGLTGTDWEIGDLELGDGAGEGQDGEVANEVWGPVVSGCGWRERGHQRLTP